MANHLNSVSLEEPAAAAPTSRSAVEKVAASKRIPAFDFTKGALVLFMVLYHWLNYFVGPHGEYYKYLHFLTPSFIFITGYLISHVHFGKYGAGSGRLSGRLLVRGLKILAVFVVMNLLIAIFWGDSSVRRVFFNGDVSGDLYTIFVSGNLSLDGIGKAAAFIILVPIGYLLICSAGLLLLCRFVHYTFHIACGVLLLCLLVLDAQGIQAENLEFLTIGLLGVVLGCASGEKVAAFVSHRFAICSVYVAHLVTIAVWGIPLAVRIASVILTTTVIYMAGDRKGQIGLLRGYVILLGQYSLFAYLWQIAILQILRRFIIPDAFGALLLSLLLGFALTMGTVKMLDRARMKLTGIDWLYKAVFA